MVNRPLVKEILWLVLLKPIVLDKCKYICHSFYNIRNKMQLIPGIHCQGSQFPLFMDRYSWTGIHVLVFMYWYSCTGIHGLCSWTGIHGLVFMDWYSWIGINGLVFVDWYSWIILQVNWGIVTSGVQLHSFSQNLILTLCLSTRQIISIYTKCFVIYIYNYQIWYNFVIALQLSDCRKHDMFVKRAAKLRCRCHIQRKYQCWPQLSRNCTKIGR